MTERPNLLKDEDTLSEPLQKRSQDKRTRLKRSALDLFGKNGYEGTSIEEIAQKADLAVGTFYQHFRSKRQLLLTLMDDLLTGLAQLSLSPIESKDIKTSIRTLLSRAFSTDLRYLGAYRAWQEAILSDPELAKKQLEIHKWTVSRTLTVFQYLHRLPGARTSVDLPGLARAMDSFIWSLLSQVVQLPKPELDQWIDSSTHLIYHALFRDGRGKTRD
jgi:AcrR family transcriptional regulator